MRTTNCGSEKFGAGSAAIRLTTNVVDCPAASVVAVPASFIACAIAWVAM